MGYRSNKHHVKQLVTMYSGICHYCDKMTNRDDPDRYPTREHVVPRVFGGPNSMDNYVLACYKCNTDRGTILFYCDCRDCQEKILDALYNPEWLNNVLEAMAEHNRPKVFYNRNKRSWWVRIGHNRKPFESWEDAINFAFDPTAALARDRDYE